MQEVIQRYKAVFECKFEANEVVKELCDYDYTEFLYNTEEHYLITEDFKTAMLILDICRNDGYFVTASVHTLERY